jgi:hypothetical protein
MLMFHLSLCYRWALWFCLVEHPRWCCHSVGRYPMHDVHDDRGVHGGREEQIKDSPLDCR